MSCLSWERLARRSMGISSDGKRVIRDALMYYIRPADGRFQVDRFIESDIEDMERKGWVLLLSMSQALDDHIEDTRREDEKGPR